MSWLLTVTAIWSLLRLKTTLTRAARVEKNGKALQCKNQNAELKRAKMLLRAEGSCGEAVKSHLVASLLLVTGHIIHIQCCDCRQKKSSYYHRTSTGLKNEMLQISHLQFSL